jgi:hypothetical protein
MGAVFGIRSGTEQVPYKVIESRGNFEIRSYGKRVVIETLLNNSDNLTESQGFRTLASYIFGKNDDHKRFDMTAPVEVRPNDHCATAENGAELKNQLLSGGMVMRFTLPHKVLSEQELPKPLDQRVNVTEVVPQLYAVVRFSGTWSEEVFQERAKELLDELSEMKNYQQAGAVVSWRFDPPWTLSCFRRNEVAVPVETSNRI